MTKDNEITALGEFNKKFENTYKLFKKNLENDEEAVSYTHLTLPTKA